MPDDRNIHEVKASIRNAVALLEKEVARAIKEGAMDDALVLLKIMEYLDPEKKAVIEMAIKLLKGMGA